MGSRPMSAIDFYTGSCHSSTRRRTSPQHRRNVGLVPYPADDEAAGPVDLGEILAARLTALGTRRRSVVL